MLAALRSTVNVWEDKKDKFVDALEMLCELLDKYSKVAVPTHSAELARFKRPNLRL